MSTGTVSQISGMGYNGARHEQWEEFRAEGDASADSTGGTGGYYCRQWVQPPIATNSSR
jgi:hypothetical protein